MSDDRLPDLYLEASELAPAERRELVAELRRGDPALADALERLLRFDSSDPSPIDGSPWRGDAVAPARPSGDELPRQIGRFRILRELGRGGMGRVFLAEEATEDFRRTIALKLVDSPGPDEEAIRRFRDEVRILAALEHPGIARFLDGGRSPEGVWFLALEYVDGRNLLEHAGEQALPVRARVELFLAVLDAVAYAHERGVVHRDLKPSNVMVGRDGRPRLLDFGISKAVGAGVESLVVTHTDWRPLTPAYASPEQFRGDPVSPRSDVYSLGVMLYELLSGRRPFAESGDSRSAIERAVLSSDPEPPSTAARARRRTTDASLGRRRRVGRGEIDRDLDAICLAALRRQPELRYAGAAEFAADLRRYVAGRPVAARRARRRLPGSPRVRLAGALAALLALAGAGGYLLLREGAGAPQAAEADRPATRRGFPFDPATPPPIEQSERRWAESPGDVVAGAALAIALARERRIEEAKIVVGRMRQIPGRELDPLTDYAEGKVAANADEEQRALVLYSRALESALAQGRDDLVGGIRLARGSQLGVLGHRNLARDELERASRELERQGDHALLYRALNDLSIEYFQRGEMDKGRAALERALAAAGPAGFQPLVVLGNLAELDLLGGRPDLAESRLREVLALRRAAPGPSPAREGQAMLRLAAAVQDLGKTDEAERLIGEAIARFRASASLVELPIALHRRAVLEVESGRLSGIAPTIAELESLARDELDPPGFGYARWLAARGAALAGDLEAARREFAEGRRLLAAHGDRDLAAELVLDWAAAEAGAGDAASARRLLDDVLASLEQPRATLPGYFAEVQLARLDAEGGDPGAGRTRLAALGEDGSRSRSVRRRIAYLGARAALAAADRRWDDARSDLDAALVAARDAGRRLAELELRLDRARLGPAPSRDAALEVAREARALGLLAQADRARLLAGGASRAASSSPAARR